jgi:hypothetical protein
MGLVISLAAQVGLPLLAEVGHDNCLEYQSHGYPVVSSRLP